MVVPSSLLSGSGCDMVSAEASMMVEVGEAVVGAVCNGFEGPGGSVTSMWLFSNLMLHLVLTHGLSGQ